MNRKSKIIVSVVGITIVLLALLGITYAYYLTRIEGNTNTNSISVTTADLKLKYGDGNGVISKSDIMPGTTITKTFSVKNDGESKVENYVVVLEQIVNTLTRTSDLTYTLECKLANGNSCGSTELVDNKGPVFPSGVTEKAIFLNSIDKDVTHYYTLVVTYENLTNTDQSDDMGSSISAKVNIKDKSQIDVTGLRNPSITLASVLLSAYGGEDNIIELNNFSASTQAGEGGLYKTRDDYGTSYYFRGDVTNNYVKFAEYNEIKKYGREDDLLYDSYEACMEAVDIPEACEELILIEEGTPMYWRIVRINGNGTIRMIYDGTQKEANGVDADRGIGETNYNINFDDKMYVGYMYGTDEDPYGDASETILTDSAIKETIDDWYEDTLESRYDTYIADSIFCNDREEQSVDSVVSYKNNVRVQTNNPTLMCENQRDRFTMNDTTLGNGKLTYSIGLLTVDEALFAGYSFKGTTINNYLASDYFYTSSPSFSDPDMAEIMIFYVGPDNIIRDNVSYNSTAYGYYAIARPVINLKADVPFTIDEDGTYVITTS